MYVRRLAAVVTIAALSTTSSGSAQSPVSFAAETSLMSRYMFAGIPFSSDAVQHAQVSASGSGLTVYGFATWDHDLGEVVELDVYGDYYRQLAPTVGAYVGLALYSFKLAGSFDGTPEIYGGVTVSALLNPTLHVAHDFDLGSGTHATLMLSHAVALGTSGASLRFSGDVDYNDGYWEEFWQVNGEASGLSYADVGATLDLPVGPLTVSPGVVLLFAIHEDFVDEQVFGLTASMSF